MNIGYFGDGEWGRRALDLIVETERIEVDFIVARHSEPDERLKESALRLDVPFWAPSDVNDPAFLKTVRSADVDLNVSMSFDQIIGSKLLHMAPEGFINCHAGALPFYRGRNVLNWAIINGEDEFGVTVHYMDEGIDSGDIIEQRFAPIDRDDDYASVLDRAVPLCARTLQSALIQVRDDAADPTPQEEIHPTGFYCSRRKEGDEWIDWNWSSERVYNFIRGIAPPGPGARTRLGDRPLVILASELIPGAPAYIGRPGTVVGQDEHGNVIKTGDTFLRINRISDWKNGQWSNERNPHLSIGTVLGEDV